MVVPTEEFENVPLVRERPLDADIPAAERLPVSTVEVPVTVERIFPPVIVMPPVVLSPRVSTPPEKVEVAVVLATFKMPEKVVDALSESMATMGAVFEVPVAMVKAYLVLVGIVVVADRA